MVSKTRLASVFMLTVLLTDGDVETSWDVGTDDDSHDNDKPATCVQEFPAARDRVAQVLYWPGRSLVCSTTIQHMFLSIYLSIYLYIYLSICI